MNSNQVDVAKDFVANLLDNRIVVDDRQMLQKNHEFNMVMDHHVRKSELNVNSLKSNKSEAQQVGKDQCDRGEQKSQNVKMSQKIEAKQKDDTEKSTHHENQISKQCDDKTVLHQEMKKENETTDETTDETIDETIDETQDDTKENIDIADNPKSLEFLYMNNLLAMDINQNHPNDQPYVEIKLDDHQDPNTLEVRNIPDSSIHDVAELLSLETDSMNEVNEVMDNAMDNAIVQESLDTTSRDVDHPMINQLDDQNAVTENNRYRDLLSEIHYAAVHDNEQTLSRADAIRQAVVDRQVFNKSTLDSDYKVDKNDFNRMDHQVGLVDREIKLNQLNVANQNGQTSNNFNSSHEQFTYQLMHDVSKKMDKVSTAQRNFEIRPVYYQVQEAIKVGVREEKNHLTIKLDPPEWGAIKIVLSQKNGDLNINLTTGQDFVKTALDRNMQELREGLKQLDIHLGSLDVQVDFSSGQQRQGAADDPNLGAPTLFTETKESPRKRQTKSNAIVDDLV